MGAFLGTLNSNEIFSALFNMIISQEVFADNIGKHQTLVDKARVDGGLYGDTKLFYATDALKSAPWGNDAEATNLLALHRPPAPSTQGITLDTFRQISLTVDNYLSKRAWADEGAFSSFNSVLLGWVGETRKICDGTLYNVFIGTTKASTGKQTQTLTLASTLTAEERAKKIGEKIANLMVEMEDYSRDYNDYEYLRSYAKDAIKVIWNAKYMNEIRKVDLPSIFHNDNIVAKLEEDYMAKRYFGTVIDSSNYSTYQGSGKVIKSDYTYDSTKGTLRATKELDVTVGGTTYHYFAGDELTASGATFKTSGGTFNAGDFYIEDNTVICKVLVKLPPFMSAFQVGTSFFNPKSLTENHYLTWGYNTLEYLKNYPFITISEVNS